MEYRKICYLINGQTRSKTIQKIIIFIWYLSNYYYFLTNRFRNLTNDSRMMIDIIQ